jgi:hypothetical protein
VVYAAQDPQDSIGAGYVVWQGQILPQPFFVSFTEKDDIFHAFNAADHGDNAEQQYIHQVMFFTALDPGSGIRASPLRISMFPLHPVPIGFFLFFLRGFIMRLPWPC